ncbi:indole-3-glycerol phosphate synthase TrpC [Haliangium sp.]|uniref:indole-3-glycerol phosphate synthase TrpC n=1 Tax=Haliangium sp. TaxID=2663208 RepID=UPI003D1070B4
MSILARILDVKRDELARAQARRPLAELTRAAEAAEAPRSLAAALRRGDGEPVRVIAEIKRASPSAGPIRPDADPADIAARYQAAGAAAISVLTDESFFDGRLAFLGRARSACALPLLRKDFLIDPYQVIEARAAGADAVLLIVAALDQDRLEALLAQARTVGMDALVEVHDAAEAARAVAAGASIIGVNHRNLATFEVDTGLTARLRPSLPEDVILVGESGIRAAADVARLGAAGAHAVLVGEHLMRRDDPGQALGELVGVVP